MWPMGAIRFSNCVFLVKGLCKSCVLNVVFFSYMELQITKSNYISQVLVNGRLLWLTF